MKDSTISRVSGTGQGPHSCPGPGLGGSGEIPEYPYSGPEKYWHSEFGNKVEVRIVRRGGCGEVRASSV